jgi:hypothetical protein
MCDVPGRADWLEQWEVHSELQYRGFGFVGSAGFDLLLNLHYLAS